MKKTLKNLTAGFFWGVIFFLISTLTSGSYGFWGYEGLVKTFPFIEKGFSLTLVTLLIFYMIISMPIFILYSLFSIHKKYNERNLLAHIFSFLIFYVGFIIVFLIFLIMGLIGFSRGGFGL